MIYQGRALTARFIEPGIAELCFDLEGESVNKFNQLTLRELREAVEALNSEAELSGVLMTSAKSGFIVGADITEFFELFSLEQDELITSIRESQAVFNAVEDLPVATVTAINGVALGGGFEMCLATDYRVMSSAAQVGLPEVKLGINPGFGGTVRLPRLIGCDNAVEWAATGTAQRPERALKDGAVDAVVAPDQLRAAALQMLKDSIAGDFDWRARRLEKTSPVKLNDIERMMAFTTAKAMVAAQAGPNMPAPLRAAKSMEKSVTLERDAALQVEAENFARLARTPEAAALVGLFLNEQALAKSNRKYEGQGGRVAHAAVLGAGIMGGGIAYQSAYKGTPVLMKDIAEQGLEQGMEEAAKLLAKRVDRGRMSATEMGKALARIRPTLDYAGFDQVDIVVEAVVEKLQVKQAVLTEVEAKVGADTVLCSNTSTISISRLAESLQRPEQFCGMHFFNPVHRMPLVEVIRGAETSESTIGTVVGYAKAMGKTPIVVNDGPGFYVNRVLFPYFAGFSLLLVDGADYRQVDRVMERFGWPMGPAYLLDVVGIDTAHHAQQVMAEGFPDRMQFDGADASELMFRADRYGQKNGKGFYRYETDPKGRPVKREDPEVDALLEAMRKTEVHPFEDEDIVARMMIPMCIEAVRCLEDGIVASAGDADMGLILGIGFPLFRGGALRYMDSVGLDAFCRQAERYAALGKLYQPTETMRRMAAEGRRFFS